jgi:hypothetical protein
VVRGTLPRPSDGLNGAGMIVVPLERDPNASVPVISVSRSLFADNHTLGIAVSGAQASIEATIVRDTQIPPAVQMGGRGINFETNLDYLRRAEGEVRGVVVQGNAEYGIVAIGSDLRVESAWVTDTAPRPDGLSGRGIGSELEIQTGELAAVEVYDSLVERSSEYGVGVIGGTLHVENTTVRDTRADGQGLGGWGIVAQVEISTTAESHADVVRCLSEGNREANVVVGGATMTLVSSIVRDALAQPDTDLFGDGIVVVRFERDDNGFTQFKDSSLEMSATVIETSARAGILNFGGSVTLADTWMSCNPLDLDGESEFTFDDLGGNVCLCGDELFECKVLSTGLAAPGPVQ